MISCDGIYRLWLYNPPASILSLLFTLWMPVCGERSDALETRELSPTGSISTIRLFEEYKDLLLRHIRTDLPLRITLNVIRAASLHV